MKKIVFVLLALLMLGGCAKEEETLPVSVRSDKLPIDFQVDGEKCSFVSLYFLEDVDAVYILAMIEASDSVTEKLDTLCVDFYFKDWGNYGRKVFHLGSRVCICSKFQKEKLGDSLTYTFFVVGNEKGGITYEADVVLAPFEEFPSLYREKIAE